MRKSFIFGIISLLVISIFLAGCAEIGGQAVKTTSATNTTKLRDLELTSLSVVRSLGGAVATIQSTSTQGWSSINFLDSRGALQTFIGYGNSKAIAFAGQSYVGSMGDLIFGLGNSEKVRITSKGNVGIGTTSPVAQLHVKDQSSNAGLLIETPSGYWPEIKLDQLGSKSWRIGHNGTDFHIRVWQGSTLGWQDRLTLMYNGNVGIGTTSPTRKLSIEANDALIGLANTLNGMDIGVTMQGEAVVASAGGLWFRAGTGTMRIDTAGNVGIGTTSPASTLHINGGGGLIITGGNISTITYPQNSIRIFHDGIYGWITNGFGPLILSPSGNGIETFNRVSAEFLSSGWPVADSMLAKFHANIGSWDNQSLYSAYFSGGKGVNIATGNLIVKTGNVGIGIINPSEKVDIVGNVKFSGKLLMKSSDSKSWCCGPSTIGTWSCTSSNGTC